jgi:hypothetical protein
MNILSRFIRAAGAALALAAMLSCPGKDKPTAPEGYNLDALGIPRFVRAHFIDPGRLARISRFRSAVGFDYSDDLEPCRSMMNWFQLRSDVDWRTLKLYSPAVGKITSIERSADGAVVKLKSSEYPDFEFHLFNLAVTDSLLVGADLRSGQQVGSMVRPELLPGIAVGAHTTSGWRLLCYFEVMTDSLFATYGKCDVYTRYDFIIGKEARDADPLSCQGGEFASEGHLDNWRTMSCHYDIDAWGYPRFVDVNYIEFDRIYRFSKFRSAVGHDYSDDFEDCRSMKHYFMPNGETGWEKVKIYSPVDGTVAWRFEEFMGSQVWIRSRQYPDFQFGLFHLTLADTSLREGRTVTAGQLLGTHFSTRTYSDIAVSVDSPGGGRKLVSYFEVMSDALFERYRARGIAGRSDAIISRQERDAHPLTCSGETFVGGTGVLEDWFTLTP